MKRYIPFLFVLVLPFYGCDEVEELLEFDVSLGFEGDLLITEQSAAGDISDDVRVSSETAVYRIKDDPDVAEYLAEGAEIKEIKIESIRYSYKDFEGNQEARVQGGAFQLFDVGRMWEQSFPLSESNVNIAEADFNNEVFALLGDFSSIENGLTNSGLFAIRYQGTFSDNPVDFKVGISVRVTVTIKPAL